MNKYVDLVVCKHEGYAQNFLFYAPNYSCIENGSKVKVDTEIGVKDATVVVSRAGVSEGGSEYHFICKSLNATLPLKRVIGVYKPLDYKEGM